MDEKPHQKHDSIDEAVIKKLNHLMKDDDFRTELKYFFEPLPSQHEEIFTFSFHDTFNKKSLELVWDTLKEKLEGGSVDLLRDLDKETLKKFHEYLEHLEMKQRIKQYASKKPDYIDFYEDDALFIVAVEIPAYVVDEDIEIAGSPHEIEIVIGETFKKTIKIKPRIDPESALAHHENGILEIKLCKAKKTPKTKITLSSH
ncbi:hypothetical protein [Candidatus Lokiarchaeum ossiferum]|uniref:hypothetical protein n=1 Tax=Candidatus Lokiarchaeum ossiferum TaxID=2951803 RepID=UPI00352D8AA4